MEGLEAIYSFHTNVRALQVRVRVAVGDCLQVLAHNRGAVVLEQCIETILLSIHENYVRPWISFAELTELTELKIC